MAGAVLATFAGAVVLGWTMGWFAERYRRARADYHGVKKGLPGLQKAMWSSFRRVAGRILIAAVLLGAAIFGWAQNQ